MIRLKFATVLFLPFFLIGCSKPHPTITLHEAAKTSNTQQIESNIYWGCDVNAFGPDGETPLFWAALNGNQAIVEMLLNAGADPLIEMKQEAVASMIGERAVDVAQDEKIIRLLVAKNPRSINFTASRAASSNGYEFRPDGQTSLHIAAGEGAVDKVRLLLQLGIDPTIRDSKGQIALDVAKKSQQQAKEGLGGRDPKEWDETISVLEKAKL